MDEFHMLSPEVAGQLGDKTVLSPPQQPDSFPNVSNLEYVFDGWLGDELLESFPCFIVSNCLAEALAGSGISGLELDTVTVSKSDEFREMYPRPKLPSFRRLKPQGRARLSEREAIVEWSGHDLCLSQDANLVVTAKALAVLRGFKIDNCDIVDLVDRRQPPYL